MGILRKIEKRKEGVHLMDWIMAKGWIRRIVAEMLPDSGGGDGSAVIPAPTEADNGKVLVAQDGAVQWGYGLPVVELSTAIANGSTLTDEENAKLTAAFETGMPIVLKIALQSIGDGISADSFIGVAHRAISDGVMMFVLPFSQTFILLYQDGLSWVCAVE